MHSDPLGRRARREAIVSRPAFSLALHARLRQAVLGTPPPMPLDVKSSSNRVGAWVATSAAALLLVATAIGWQRRETPRFVAPIEPGTELAEPALATAQPNIASEPEAALADEPRNLGALAGATAAELDRLMATAVEGHQWADYDFHVQLALKEYAEQLPIDLSPALAWSGLVADEDTGGVDGGQWSVDRE